MRSVSSEEPRLLGILEEYLAALEAGTAPDREALLARHPELAEPLKSALLGLDFVRRTAERLPSGSIAGHALGDYRLLREVGRGGMAVVYEAEQVSLGRRVALKVLPFAAVLDPKQLQRFKNEAQAAAHLHHTNIVPVYAVGCERGVHYYAMQYVDGESLATAIRGMKGGGGGEGRSPISSHGSNREPAFIRMAAALGAQAAEALDHAHQLGIVHRDVKPGNLLVDATGTVWITDFGLARSMADVGLTVTGEILGTIRYMSPEQALAKRVPVDHRTDVYSLGATLYELFTLEAAFPGDDPHHVIQDIAMKEPASPRRLNPALPVDLETVLLKAMSKDPAGRYATAQEMADDLRRYLEDKPVVARRPSVAVRMAKWSRRHRGLVAASFAVLLVTVVALAIGAARLATEKRSTKAALDKADVNLRFALEAVDRFLVQIGVYGIQTERVPSVARKELLAQALRFYDTYLEGRKDPAASINRGLTLGALQRYEEALGAFDGALALEPNNVHALGGKGASLWYLKRHPEALPFLDQAERVDPQNGRVHELRGSVYLDLARPEEALAACNRAIEIDPSSYWAHRERGRALASLGRHEEALAAYDRAIEIDPGSAFAWNARGRLLSLLRRHEEALAAFDRAIGIVPNDAKPHTNRGITLMSVGRPEEALAACDRAIALDPDDAMLHTNRGIVLASLGRHVDALAAFDRAIELEPELAGAHDSRGNTLWSLGRPEEALAACDRAIALDPKRATAHCNRGIALAALGRREDALAAFDRAIELNPRLALAHCNRGSDLWSLGRPEEALSACDRAIELDPRLTLAHCNRGGALWSLGRPDEALAAYDRAIELDPRLAMAHSNRGHVLASLGRYEEALDACDRAIQVQPGYVWAYSVRGDVLLASGRRGEGLAHYQKAFDLGLHAPEFLNRWAWALVARRGADRSDAERAVVLAKESIKRVPGDSAARNTLGVALVRCEAWKEALDAFETSMDLSGGGDASDWFFVAMAQWHLGRKDEARKWYDKAVAWMDASKQDDEELKRFRDEAAGLMGVQ